MFKNIGGKIKVLAVILCILGMVASVVIGVIMIAGGGFLTNIGRYGGYAYGSSAGSAAIVVGILIIIFGCLFSWIGSFALYGYGELIVKTTETAENTRALVMSMMNNGGGNGPAPAQEAQPGPAPNIAPGPSVCPSCGAVNSPDVNFCVNCGSPLH